VGSVKAGTIGNGFLRKTNAMAGCDQVLAENTAGLN
jgi:hypothetical protein